MGNSLHTYLKSQNSYPVNCKCGRIATYRCQYNGTTQGYGDIPGHPLIKPYWSGGSFSIAGGGSTRFTACDKCITQEVILYFTNIPSGWSENIKYGEDYEDINLDWGKSKLK